MTGMCLDGMQNNNLDLIDIYIGLLVFGMLEMIDPSDSDTLRCWTGN